MAFGHGEYYEERSRGDVDLQSQSSWAQLKRSKATQIAATVWVGLRRSFERPQPELNKHLLYGFLTA
jgi:hypothetical protein